MPVKGGGDGVVALLPPRSRNVGEQDEVLACPVRRRWKATVASENDRSRYDPTKSERELGLRFRPVEEALRDEVAWFRANGQIPK